MEYTTLTMLAIGLLLFVGIIVTKFAETLEGNDKIIEQMSRLKKIEKDSHERQVRRLVDTRKKLDNVKRHDWPTEGEEKGTDG